ncbi:MAG: hypothetical protein RSB82_05000 [Victivallaceae bacterium]
MFGNDRFSRIRTKIEQIVPTRKGAVFFEREVSDFQTPLPKKLTIMIRDRWDLYKYAVVLKELKESSYGSNN